MKAYCENCGSLEESRFLSSQDAVTGAPYEDLCCNSCDFIIATVQEREGQAALQAQPTPPNAAFARCLLNAAAKSGDPGAIELAAQLAGVPACKDCGYVIQHCRCAAQATPPVGQAAAEPVADCGEAGHTEGACGNASCLTNPVAFIRRDQLQKASKQAMLCEVGPDARQDKVGIYTTPQPTPDAEAIRLALEAVNSFALWADSQADAQSKGGHATFDIMQLREQRDIATVAIAALEKVVK